MMMSRYLPYGLGLWWMVTSLPVVFIQSAEGWIIVRTTITTPSSWIGPKITRKSVSRRRRRRPTTILPRLQGTTVDYEYIPPNSEDDDERGGPRPPAQVATPSSSPSLSSTYPPGTPAGLRGEAVRSALRSGQCLAWNLAGTPLEQGLVTVTGPGTLNFLNHKFTRSFRAPAALSGPAHHPRVIKGSQVTAGFLTARGRLLDRLAVAVTGPSTAYLLTSPGHSAPELFRRLDPFVFPLDQVQLTDTTVLGPESSSSSSSSRPSAVVFTLLSTQLDHVQKAFDREILPHLGRPDLLPTLTLPQVDTSAVIVLGSPTDSEAAVVVDENHQGPLLLILPTSGLPTCAGVGYTFGFVREDLSQGIGAAIWRNMIAMDNAKGPVEIGALEYETLRIETGCPAFGREITGRDEKNAEATTPASPLELHMSSLLDINKGCYLGQEGLASILKNPRGPPRTLYQVEFDDEFNLYDFMSAGDYSSSSQPLENLTRIPHPGQKLYALGSNEQIWVGTLTSVAEPGATGQAVTLGLALVRRPDSILKQMKEMELDIPRDDVLGAPDLMSMSEDGIMDVGDGSGIIPPPPLDPLDGLEVIVGGTFTVGKIRMLPSRRFPLGQCMFDYDPLEDFPDYDAEFGKNKWVEVIRSPRREPSPSIFDPWSTETESSVSRLDEILQADDDEGGADDEKSDSLEGDAAAQAELELAREEARMAEAQAEAAAAEAKRKAEKLEMLKKRADEALARRKQKGTKSE